jgi:hypothetical protein
VASKSKKTAALSDSRSRFEGARLLYPVLASCGLNRNDRPEGTKDAEPRRFYDCRIRPVESPDEPLSVAVCDFAAGQQIDDTRILEIEGTYFVGFEVGRAQLSAAERRQLIEQLSIAAAWPMFRDLFIHIGSQSGEELPLLPNIPKVRWLTAIEGERSATMGKKP